MMSDFEYFAPQEVGEALEFLAAHKGEAKILAGGQSLLILLRQGLVAPENIIDIKGLRELDYLRSTADGGLAIGALCSHRAVELSPLVREGFGSLAQMEQNVASVETRNWGTLAGNVCHADPAGDPGPLLVALGAQVKLRSVRGERSVTVEDFSTDYYETVLEEDELLVEIEIPKPAARSATAYEKFSHLTGDHALVSVAVTLTLDEDGACAQARVVLGAVNAIPTRATRAEEMLRGQKLDEGLIGRASEAAMEAADPVTDMHASDEYRRHMVGVLARKLIAQTWQQALRA